MSGSDKVAPSDAVPLRTIDASPYQVLVPEGAIGGRYSPEEAQRLADSITAAAKVAADPGLAIRRHGSPRRRFAVYLPLSVTLVSPMGRGD